MALRRWLLWSALPALVAAAAPAVAALAECDATALLQSHSDVEAAAATQGRLRPQSQRTKQADAPQITSNNYWMFNYGRHRPKSQVEKTIVIMTNYTAIARAYPDFVIPNTGSAANGTATPKKILGDLKGAFTNLKRDLTTHQKVLQTALFQIHMNLPLALQAKDTPFQEQWRGAFHDIILAVQRHRNFLAGLGASDKKLCSKTADFLDDLRWQGGNYSRFMDEAASLLPPPLPEGNGFINATALEARRKMFDTSKIMVLHMAEQVKAVLVPWMDQWMGCELGSPPAAPAMPAEVQLQRLADQPPQSHELQQQQLQQKEQQLQQQEQQLQRLRQQVQRLQQQPQPAAPQQPPPAPQQPEAPQPPAALQPPAAQQQRQAGLKRKNPWPDIETEAEAAAELREDVPEAAEQQQQEEEQPQPQPQQQEEAQQKAAGEQGAEPQQEPQRSPALRRTCRVGVSAAALFGLLSVC